MRCRAVTLSMVTGAKAMKAFGNEQIVNEGSKKANRCPRRHLPRMLRMTKIAG